MSVCIHVLNMEARGQPQVLFLYILSILFFFFFTTECFAGLGLTEETVPESSKGLPGSASPGLSVHVYTIMPALFRGDLGTEFRSSWFHGNHFNNGTMIPAP